MTPSRAICYTARGGRIVRWRLAGVFPRPLVNQGGALVGSLGFSPDGRWLVSTCGGGHDCARQPQSVWDVGTGQRIQTYAKHDNVVLASPVSPDGRLVATPGGDNNEIHIWDARTGETRQVLRGSGVPIWAAGFAADGSGFGWGRTWTKHDPAAGYGPLQWHLRLPRAGQVLGRPERLTPARSSRATCVPAFSTGRIPLRTAREGATSTPF
jgi:hypothetical protein